MVDGMLDGQEEKLRQSFKLVKEDTADLYNKIADLSDTIDEMRLDLRTLADKIVKKADKKPVKKKKIKKKKH